MNEQLENLLNVAEADEGSEPHLRMAKACMLIESISEEELAEVEQKISEWETTGPLLHPGEHDFDETERMATRARAIRAAKEELETIDG